MKLFDPLYILTAARYLVRALPTVLYLLLFSLLFSMLLGAVIAVAKIRKLPVVSQFFTVFISFVRGTPDIVQLFIIYYGLPKLTARYGVNLTSLDRTFFVIFAFSLNHSAFMSEVFRSAYLSVDRGQREAALSVGMTELSAFTRVVLPQATLVALPNLGNTIIRILHGTSLAFTIGAIDLMGEAQIVNTWLAGMRQLEIYLSVSFIYWLICLGIERLFRFLEASFGAGRRTIAA